MSPVRRQIAWRSCSSDDWKLMLSHGGACSTISIVMRGSAIPVAAAVAWRKGMKP